MPKESIEREWISYPEAEQYSGLSHTSLWRRVRSGQLKAAKVGRSVRINLRSLRKFMERCSDDGSALPLGTSSDPTCFSPGAGERVDKAACCCAENSSTRTLSCPPINEQEADNRGE